MLSTTIVGWGLAVVTLFVMGIMLKRSRDQRWAFLNKYFMLDKRYHESNAVHLYYFYMQLACMLKRYSQDGTGDLFIDFILPSYFKSLPKWCHHLIPIMEKMAQVLNHRIHDITMPIAIPLEDLDQLEMYCLTHNDYKNVNMDQMMVTLIEMEKSDFYYHIRNTLLLDYYYSRKEVCDLSAVLKIMATRETSMPVLFNRIYNAAIMPLPDNIFVATKNRQIGTNAVMHGDAIILNLTSDDGDFTQSVYSLIDTINKNPLVKNKADGGLTVRAFLEIFLRIGLYSETRLSKINLSELWVNGTLQSPDHKSVLTSKIIDSMDDTQVTELAVDRERKTLTIKYLKLAN